MIELGWTLLSAQEDGRYFTSANWQSANTHVPQPFEDIYSILGKADTIRGDQHAEYMYMEHAAANRRDTARWMTVKQSRSILDQVMS